MSNMETYERIERYLEGKMKEIEREAFEKELLSSADLAHELSDMRLLRKQLSQYRERTLLKEQLDEFHHEMRGKSFSVEFRKYLKPLSVAASFILLGSLAFLFYSNQQGMQKVYYKELKREIDQLKTSQKKIVHTLKTESTQKFATPSRYGGTAFVIHREGYLVTTYHVVKKADSIIVENEQFGRRRVEVVHVDPSLDLAILKLVAKKPFASLPYGFASAPKAMGDRIFTLGYPREETVYGEGYIGSSSGYEGDSASYQIALPLNPGNSGGPLFDQKGNVVGIVSGKHTTAEGAGFAIKTIHLKNLFHSLPDQAKPLALPISSHLASFSRAQQIARVQGFVFKLEVY